MGSSSSKVKDRVRESSSDSIRPGPHRVTSEAPEAVEAAEAAGAQGRFWEMHDRLYENQRHLRDDDLRSYAEALDLEIDLFDKGALRTHAR